jgi:hypothetical protein
MEVNLFLLCGKHKSHGRDRKSRGPGIFVKFTHHGVKEAVSLPLVAVCSHIDTD